MIDINSSNFSYTATLKLADLPSCPIQKKFPAVTDLAVNSRTFSTYVECVNSAKNFMEEVVKDINESQETQLTVAAEINPLVSGVETRSKDWSGEELARLWIFEKVLEGTKNIYAMGQARIFALEKPDQAFLIN